MTARSVSGPTMLFLSIGTRPSGNSGASTTPSTSPRERIVGTERRTSTVAKRMVRKSF